MEVIKQFLYNTLHINTVKYELNVILFFTIGTGFWVYTYVNVIQNIFKYDIVEIPGLVAPLNLSWEFCWGFILVNDYGPIFKYAAIVWFLMDCYINYKLWAFGKKLVTHPLIYKYYFFIWLFLVVGGGFITSSMKDMAIDDGIGIVSAYFINLLIAGSYLYQLINFPQLRDKGFSYKIAWGKFLGTFPVSIGCFFHADYRNNDFVMTMCVLVTILDILYLHLFKKYDSIVQAQRI